MTSHSKAHGMSESREYTSWCKAKSRCNNRNDKKYCDYGGRGIRMCKEWENSFVAFFTHIGPRPSSKHSLDRMDVNGPYAPGNVRWATAKEQCNNRRVQSFHNWNGRTMTLAEIAAQEGVTYRALWSRLKWRNQTLEHAIISMKLPRNQSRSAKQKASHANLCR